MQFVYNGSNYKFIPSLSSVEVKSMNECLNNDVHQKYEATIQMNGEMISSSLEESSDGKKSREKKLIKESYEDYLQMIANRNPKKDKWIYNIIDGTAEQESILFKDDLCIVIPTYIWNGKNIDKLHILTMPTDISLRCIRSLDSSHISLLEHMKKKTLEIIQHKYGVEEYQLKMYFHYEPSTYHLHIHFVHINNHESRCSVECSHELQSVINNLSICSNYYKQFPLLVRK